MVASCVVLCVLEMMSCKLQTVLAQATSFRLKWLTRIQALQKCGVDTLTVLPA